MRVNHLSIAILLYLSTVVMGADVSDVISNPKKYDQRRLELIGIARVPGEFFLFADAREAAKINSDVSKALYVREKTPGEPDYTNLDRQWVRITGVVNANAHGRG